MALTILVTGANGQLGKELEHISQEYTDWTFHFMNREQLDLSNAESIVSTIREVQPDYVINTGAYTKVDLAEDEPEKAYQINTKALISLSEACNEVNASIIHFSSDYVYDSVVDRPLLEDDNNNPQSVYAKSKYEGEEIVKEKAQKWIIIRTSWVYSSYGHNFVKTMLRLGASRDELNIVNDQIGTPTYARDIARVTLMMVEKMDISTGKNVLSNEIYNFSNNGFTSWDAFAKKIFDLSNIECQVNGITTASYGAKAARPLWSVLSKEKIETTLGIHIRSWEVALEDCLKLLHA